jgi:hypothetical protein
MLWESLLYVLKIHHQLVMGTARLEALGLPKSIRAQAQVTVWAWILESLSRGLSLQRW